MALFYTWKLYIRGFDVGAQFMCYWRETCFKHLQ